MSIEGVDRDDVARHEAAHGVLGRLSGAPVRSCRVFRRGDRWQGQTILGGAPDPSLERVAAARAGYAYDAFVGRHGAPSTYDEAVSRPVDPAGAARAANGLFHAGGLEGDTDIPTHELMRMGWDLACDLVARHAEWIDRVAALLVSEQSHDRAVSGADIDAAYDAAQRPRSRSTTGANASTSRTLK